MSRQVFRDAPTNPWLFRRNSRSLASGSPPAGFRVFRSVRDRADAVSVNALLVLSVFACSFRLCWLIVTFDERERLTGDVSSTSRASD